MMDTNAGSPVIARALRASFDGKGFAVQPPLGTTTTSKMRSRLHGQIYDDDKCDVIVRASKDMIVARSGVLSRCTVFPELSNETTLPSIEWASDHALVTSVWKRRRIPRGFVALFA